MKSWTILCNMIVMVSLTTFGQENIRLNVCDALTRIGIPYATVKVLHKPAGVFANEDGLFIVKVLKSDSLLVSCVGYKPERFVISQADTIFLQPIVVALDEVKVSAKKRKEKSFGYYNKTKTNSIRSKIQIEHAIKLTIPPEFISYRVKKVKIKCGNRKDSNPVRLHIYSQGKDGMPDKELLPKDIIVNNNLKMNDEIDISNLNLVLSERVLFIGIEWINTNYKPKSGVLNWIWVGYTNYDPDNKTIYRTLRDPDYRWRDDLLGSNYQNLMVSLIID